MSFYIPEQLEEEKAVEEMYNNAVRALHACMSVCLCVLFWWGGRGNGVD